MTSVWWTVGCGPRLRGGAHNRRRIRDRQSSSVNWWCFPWGDLLVVAGPGGRIAQSSERGEGPFSAAYSLSGRDVRRGWRSPRGGSGTGLSRGGFHCRPVRPSVCWGVGVGGEVSGAGRCCCLRVLRAANRALTTRSGTVPVPFPLACGFGRRLLVGGSQRSLWGGSTSVVSGGRAGMPARSGAAAVSFLGSAGLASVLDAGSGVRGSRGAGGGGGAGRGSLPDGSGSRGCG